MKRIFFAAMLIMVSLTASAVGISHLNIDVDVDSDGFANIIEKYDLQFISPFEKDEFNQQAIDNSSSIQAWQADYSFFYPRFAEDISKLSATPPAKITYESDLQRLTFEYSLRERFATLASQEQRSDFFVIDDRQLAAFLEASTIVIPSDTTISITLPQNSEIDVSQLPEKASVNGNTIVLNGIQTNSLSIDYRVVKSIAPNSGDLFRDISGNYVVIGPVVIVLAIILYVKREDIEKRIENYLVRHSEIKTRQEEEIELELD